MCNVCLTVDSWPALPKLFDKRLYLVNCYVSPRYSPLGWAVVCLTQKAFSNTCTAEASFPLTGLVYDGHKLVIAPEI